MDADVAIVGGGLAGLTLARQLKLATPDIRIVVMERGKRPAPEASYKVGESSVEVGAHYFGERLGLKEHIEKEQLPKLGLRYFFPHGDNSDIAKRFEIGPSKYPAVPSYQLDRGRFENHIHNLNIENGITIYDQARVQAVEIDAENLHEVSFIRDGEVEKVRARWLIDAAGRNRLIKRKLKIKEKPRLNNNAVWFRLDTEIDITTWCDDPEWKNRATVSKRFSTNHLMGPGYWVWLIPLGSGSTSVGIVVDASLHSIDELNSFDKSLKWLYKYEPQCARVIEGLKDNLQDFCSLRNYAHSCDQVFSADRWCMTGEAGIFIDPFYSPGSDFIAYSNDFINDLITRDMRGEDVTELTATYNRVYLNFSDIVFNLYEGLYPHFGNPFVMTQKILWDSAIYLGVSCLLFFNKKFLDLEFLASIDTDLTRYNNLLYRVAQHFKKQPLEHNHSYAGAHVDLSKTYLYDVDLNKEILIEYKDNESLAKKVRENIDNLERLSKEILANKNVAKSIEMAAVEEASV